jgi:predicted nucleic acid-binding protein
MVIVDTSVWVDSMRTRDDRLNGWIIGEEILQHPFVTAEISMGSFVSANDRFRTVDLLESFEQLEIADARRFHEFVAERALFGTGVGFADAHLLLACIDHPTARFVTKDRRLIGQAQRLEIEMV